MTDPKSEETIFAEALRLPPEERAAYLAQSTSGSAELRRRVESLLGSHEAGEFLEQAAAPQLRPTRLLTVPLTEKPGDTIGRYKLLQQIGEGGCGVVYMAEQAEPVRRRVALKVIKLGMDTKSVIARFEAERQAVALMDHANIAKVFDAGATEAGRPFFVMELVRGMKITDYCDEAKLSTRARLDLFIQVCQAIQHAHQKGIIHRDIKPSNILVTVNDGVPVPKVIDFGIAKATSGQQLTDKTLFTAFEQFIGTPAYMSPEQAMLTSLDIDTRSDIYALGVLLYEMLTGKTPFDAKELLAIGLDEMRRTIREKEPERPSTRVSTLASEDLSTTAQRRGLDAPKLVSELRGDLDWIVMKALEKDRSRRYETANGLAADIQRHVNNEPVLACPPGTLYRFQKAVRRNKLAFVAGMSVAAALVIGLGVSIWMFVEQKAALKRAVAAELEQTRLRQVAEANGKKAGSEAAKSEQVAQFLKDMLAGVKPAVAAGRDTTILKEILEKTTERVGREFNNQPEVEAELSFTLGETYFWLGDQKRAEPLLQQALALQRKLFGDKSLAVITSLDVLSFVWSLQGKHEEGEAAAREALTSARQLLGNNHPIVGRELAALANVLRKSGRATEAEPYGREAVSVLRSALGNENYETTVALNKLAMILEHQGEFAEAEELMREAVATQRKLFGDGQFELANTLVILGRILAKQSKFAEAEVRIREGVAIGKKLLGDSHPDVLGMLAILADVLVQEGKLGEVEALHREYLEIARQKFGNDHSAVAESLHNLGVAIMKQGRLAEAETALREALVTTRKLDGPEHPNTAVSLYVLGNVIGQQGRWAEAEPLTREALTLRKKLLGNEDPVVAETLWHLGLILTRQDKEAEAETALREALAIFQKNEDSGAIASTLGLLAGVLTAQGKVPEAKTLYREALDLSKKPGNEHVDRCPLHLDFGNFLRDQGEFTEAEANFRGALALALAAGRKRGSEHPNLGHSVSFLIKLLEQQGRLPGEALAIYKALPESAHRPRAEVIRLWTEVLLREERFDEADKLFTETLGLNAESRLERAAFLKVRGGFAGDRGQWQAAAADLAQAIELNPDDSEVCHWLAPVLVHLGKLDAYREHCRKSLERFKKTTDPLVAERIAKDCLILPSSGADLETVSEMAERAVNATNHWAFRWFQLVKGLVEHRQGRFSSAVEWTDKALTKAGEHTVRDVAAWMVQAMAFHQRNQPDKALAALTKGSELAETKLAKLEAGDLGKDWGDWIIARTLLREARALIEARPVTAKDASK